MMNIEFGGLKTRKTRRPPVALLRLLQREEDQVYKFAMGAMMLIAILALFAGITILLWFV